MCPLNCKRLCAHVQVLAHLMQSSAAPARLVPTFVCTASVQKGNSAAARGCYGQTLNGLYLNFGRLRHAVLLGRSNQWRSAMLTKTIERSLSSRQTVRPAAAVDSRAFHPLIDLMGAGMPFGRNVEIYGENEPAEY